MGTGDVCMLQVLLLSLGAAKNKASAEAMVYHRVRSLKNFVYDDPGASVFFCRCKN